MWKNSKSELPKEVYSYGCESEYVLIAVKSYGQWEYGVAYCVRHDDGLSWIGHHGLIDPNLEIYWQEISPPVK